MFSDALSYVSQELLGWPSLWDAEILEQFLVAFLFSSALLNPPVVGRDAPPLMVL